MKNFLASFIALATVFASVPAATALTSNTISATVQIMAYNDGEEFVNIGSGFLISNDALILTNAHVITDDETGEIKENIEICTIESEVSIPNCKYSAIIWEINTELDLALITPDFEIDELGQTTGETLSIEDMQAIGLPYVDLADYNPSLGDDLTILGFPAASLNPTITLTKGIVSGFEPISLYDPTFDENWIYSIQTDAIVNSGNSGGPAFNNEEKVVGVVFAGSTEGDGGQYGYIINNDVIWLWFQELVEQGSLSQEFVDDAFNNDYVDESFADYSNLDLGELSGYDFETGDSTEIFSDVTSSTSNSTAISFLKSEGIVSGYADGSFKPANNLNRAELLKILVEGAGFSPDPAVYRDCFPDVHSEWFAKYVCFAEEQGWVVGYPDGNFKPALNINKVEAIKMLLEVFGIFQVDITNNYWEGLGEAYNDIPVDAWFSNYIATAWYLDILEEDGSIYGPATFITRGGISENIYRLLNSYQDLIEEEAFVEAFVEASCTTTLFAESGEAEMSSRLESDLLIIYKKWGFPVNDDADMDTLFTKYDTEYINGLTAEYITIDCPEIFL